MNNKWLFLINPLIALLMLSQVITSLNFYYPFLERKAFISIHVYGGYILGFLALIHLIINWFWFQKSFFKKKKGPSKSPVKK